MLTRTPTNKLVCQGLGFIMAVSTLIGCSSGAQHTDQQPIPTIDFFQAKAAPATIESTYPGTVEGSVNVDIRSQVTGYLEKIYVKEGDYVQKGQSLFQIKGEVFSEQVNNSQAALSMALANQASAKLDVEKLKPLVEGKVISDMQLKTAMANADAATAQVAQARSALGSSRINAAFALIKAPVGGFISRIPNRIGNLIAPSDAMPLTSLSEIDQVFVYFSMSDADYLRFLKAHQSVTTNQTTVTLILSDGSRYSQKGKLEVASGNIDRTTGSISLKAIFQNPDKLLRAGGSVRVVINQPVSKILTVPMACVKDIQDKFFVFTLADSNKVSMKPLVIEGHSGQNYFVKEGIKPGDKIAANNIDILGEGMVVAPRIIALDSLSQ